MNTNLSVTTEKHPLSGIRVCLVGKFTMPSIKLNKLLREKGVIDPIDHVVSSSSDDINSKPAKEATCLFVVGAEVPEDCLVRYELNCHDGFKAVKITEQELYSLMRGEITIEIPTIVKKHINLDYSYIEWNAPKNQITRKSSPFVFDMNSIISPVYGREIYVPDIEGINMSAFRQIIGNLGGYANTYYDEKTDMILLGDSTIENLKNGVKDATILKIEKEYNCGNSKIFNIQFASESAFMQWVSARLTKCPDIVTQALVDKIKL